MVGPGTGKSTTAAGLFFLMKKDYVNAELVTEYAKDLTWSDRSNHLTEQDYILAKQNHKLRRLVNKVEYAISDSPLLLGAAYFSLQLEAMNYPVSFANYLLDCYNSYNNINIYLNRVRDYNPIGRGQTEEQADQLSMDVKILLNNFNIPYFELDSDEDAPEKIFYLLKELKEGKLARC